MTCTALIGFDLAMTSSAVTPAFTALKAPKGVPDYFPPDSRVFIAVRDTLIRAADRAGYSPIELPVFEDTGLFARGVGESTDVVSKEMYTFADRGGRSVTLRPEGTAGVMRAVIEHSLDRGPLPVKLVYAGPFFRYERPQAGRYRQLQQVGIEAIGSDDPALDAEVISVADDGYRAIGLRDYSLDLTSLGDANCRPAYRASLQDYLAGLDLDEATRERASINPLRVLDDKRPELQADGRTRRGSAVRDRLGAGRRPDAAGRAGRGPDGRRAVAVRRLRHS